jgi:hypothetical protein
MRGGQRVLEVEFNMKRGTVVTACFILWMVVAEALDTCKYIRKLFVQM